MATQTEHVGSAPGYVTVPSWTVSGLGPTVTVSYDAVHDIYAVQQDSVSASFSSADRTSTSGSVDTYAQQSGDLSDELRLYNNVRRGAPTAGAPIQLTYLSYGSWSHANSQTGDTQRTYFLYGYPTAVSDMPRTGSASYQTFVTGNVRDNVAVYEVTGSATFSANFGAGNVSTDLTLIRSDQVALGTYSGTAPIGGSQFSGTFSSSSPDFQEGHFAGGFFGPAAKEMGYSFFIRNYHDPYAGATMSYYVDQWIVGTVVGKKN